MLQVSLSDREIVFKVGSEIAKLVFTWRDSMDKRVFEEQLAMGYLKKRFGEENDKYQPYYGATGGGYDYRFWVDGDKCHFQVKNSTAREALHFSEKMQTWDRQFDRDIELLYEVKGVEYENLKKSSSWVREQALTHKYVYHFGPCGLGVSIRVENTETGEVFDITDCGNW